MNYKITPAIIFIAAMILIGGKLEAQSPDTLWTFKTGNKILSSPVLIENKILVGSDDGYFFCLNSESGEEIWKFNSGYPVRSTAVVFNKLIYFESGNILYCLDLDGVEQWTLELCAESCIDFYDDWDYFHSSPVIQNDTLYICTQDGSALGINLSDQSEVFRVQTGNKAIIRTTPVISNGKIYFGDWEGIFYCYSFDTGELVWDYDAYAERAWSYGAQITTSPVLAEGKVYFAGRGSVLFCLDAESGEKIWNFRSPTSQWLVGGPVYEDGVIYLGSSDQRKFRAFNSETGEIIWQITIPINLFCTPRIVDELIYFGTGHAYYNNTGNIMVVNKTTGNTVVQFDFPTAIYSSPLCINDTVYFCTYSGDICAIKAQTSTGLIEHGNVESYRLTQNFPNPFNPSSTIEYSVPVSGHVRIEVYDSAGRLITILIDEEKTPGIYKTEFTANNLSSGVYFYTMKTDNCLLTRKMLLLK